MPSVKDLFYESIAFPHDPQVMISIRNVKPHPEYDLCPLSSILEVPVGDVVALSRQLRYLPRTASINPSRMFGYDLPICNEGW